MEKENKMILELTKKKKNKKIYITFIIINV